MSDSKCKLPIRVQVIINRTDTLSDVLSFTLESNSKYNVLTSSFIETSIKNAVIDGFKYKERNIDSIVITDMKRGCTCVDHKPLQLQNNMEERLITFSTVEKMRQYCLKYNIIVHKHAFEYGPVGTLSSDEQQKIYSK